MLVSGAYLFSGPNPFFTTRVDAKTSEQLLKEYASKDTDADNLPDWQEALYGTNPNDPNSFKAGMSDGEAVAQGLLTPKSLASQVPEDDGSNFPGTTPADDSITAQFSKKFFARYFSTRGSTPPNEQEMMRFVESAVQELSAEYIQPNTYLVRDVRVVAGSGRESLLAYASQLEEAFAANTVLVDTDALTYFENAVLKNDAAGFDSLQNISGAYKKIALAAIKIPVTAELRDTHLALVNSFMHMHESVGNMASVPTDPIRGLVGLGTYEQDASGMLGAFAHLTTIFNTNGVTIQTGESGYYIYSAAQASASALQKAEKKP